MKGEKDLYCNQFGDLLMIMETTMTTKVCTQPTTTNEMDTLELPVSESVAVETVAESALPSIPVPTTSSKTLKRCLSVPIILTTHGKASAKALLAQTDAFKDSQNDKTKSKAAETPKTCQHNNDDPLTAVKTTNTECVSKKMQMCSNPSSRDVSPTPMLNIFAPRARRYSASYSPRGGTNTATGPQLCLTSRVSQLRQEECVDMKTREVNHEREVHSAIQISQSWEDLTLAAENWSCKSDEFGNPLQVTLPTGATKCSSPSPSSNRASGNLRLPYSPSPTRRVFATRRSMSPIAIRPSQLAPVKRKFELDDNTSSWNVCSPPPLKKIFTDSNSSSVCQSPSSICPSPDSGTFDGRITPMDDTRSETSSISGWSINESSSCDSGAKTFGNKLVVDVDGVNNELCATPKNQKSFYINKHGISGTKKYIVNHASLEQQDTVKDGLIADISSGGIK